MHMLQQQQESQQRMPEQQQHQIYSSLVPVLSRVESHESGGEYNVPKYATNLASYAISRTPIHEYQYGSLVQSPMGNVFPVQGEGQQQQHQQKSITAISWRPNICTIIPPPSPDAGGYKEGKKS
mmetsp:Transcript_7258/g.18037  ORF Transcript_7258/g.18037 Transcript_7258/m.18037 type:complete len:124 (-) Transcript_7258:78-449(-)